MYYLMNLVTYFLLSAVALSITSLSLLTALRTQHYLMFCLKGLILCLVGLEVIREGLYLLNLKPMFLRKKLRRQNEGRLLVIMTLVVPFTYFLSSSLSINPVLASGLVGLLASLLVKKYEVAIYCASFAGMASALGFESISLFVLAGLITGLIYIFSQEVFAGFGGKLGAMAFFSTLVLALVNQSFKVTYLEVEVVFQFEIVVYFILGAFLTHVIRLVTGQSSVFCSSALGIIAGGSLPFLYPNQGVFLAAAVFSGTFIGMTAPNRFEKYRYFILAGCMGSLIYLYSQPYFNGLGGKLGAIAFISGLAVNSGRKSYHYLRSFLDDK